MLPRSPALLDHQSQKAVLAQHVEVDAVRSAREIRVRERIGRVKEGIGAKILAQAQPHKRNVSRALKPPPKNEFCTAMIKLIFHATTRPMKDAS